jgi:uncharacterized membrane protein
MIVFVITGLLVSAYLTYLSLLPPTSCPIGSLGFLSCNEIIYSTYSKFFGISVALLGLGWFFIAFGLIVFARRNQRFMYSVVAWSLLGAVGVAGFIYTELFLIGSVCPLCTVAHIAGVAILFLSVLGLRYHAAPHES